MSLLNPEIVYLFMLARHLFEQGCDAHTYYLLSNALGVKNHKALEEVFKERIVKDADQKYKFAAPSCC